MGNSKDFPRNMFENFNVLAVSSEMREAELNSPAAIDKQFVFEKGNILQNEPLTEVNEDEITGREESTDIFYKGVRTAAFNLSLPHAQTQHLLHILAFALSGDVTTIGVGATGKKHTITPGGYMAPHTFTGSFQEAAIQKTKFTSLMYESAEITFEKEAFVKATAGIRGTGKNLVNWREDTITAAASAVSLTLPLLVFENNLTENIHSIMVTKADGAQYPLQASSVNGRTVNLAVSANDGAGNRAYNVIYVNSELQEETITALGDATGIQITGVILNNSITNIHSIMVIKEDGLQYPLQASSVGDMGGPFVYFAVGDDGTPADNRLYSIIYAISESQWNVPARIAETPLRVSDVRVNIGGKFNGTDIIGGMDIDHEIQKIVYKLDQPLTIEARPRAAGENADNANYVVRGPRKQTATLDRDFKNVLMQAKLRNVEYFALKILCEGAEFEPGIKFTLQIILPRVAITKATRSANNAVLTEGIEMPVFDDPAGVYKSVYATIINKQTKVAALV